MANRINIEYVPALVRPSEVETAFAAATQMRERAREAAEAVAAAQKAVDEREREDVEAAAARARAGEPLGAPSRTLTKARDQLLLKQRDLNALRLAQEQAEQDVVHAIGEHSDAWGVSLREAAEQARETGHVALAALADAFAEIGDAGSAQNWLAGAMSDGRYDRPPKPVLAFALTSARRTANSEPLSVAELVGWLREAIEPPTAVVPPLERVQA